MAVRAFVLWRRLDTPGHDACRLVETRSGWRLEGTAVFRSEEAPAHLAYAASFDHSWRVRAGRVHGWRGEQAVDVRISRTDPGGWALNGAAVSGLGEVIDLDFGFTPATNLPQLRRLALAVGEVADAPAAWLDVSAGTLDALQQRYARRSDATYWYEAPRFGYADVLEVTPAGFIRRYPGLWELDF